MSGTVDTSTPAQRIAFLTLIDGGGGAALPGAAAAVAQCQSRVPETTAYLLGLPETATYAQGVALLQMRWASGRAGY